MTSAKTSLACEPDAGRTRMSIGRQGRSVLADHQWRSLARSLHLSDRELQIVQGIFDDRTEAAIASKLGISSHTVHTHLERLYHKLSVASRCALVVRVFAEHLSLESARGSEKPAQARV